MKWPDVLLLVTLRHFRTFAELVARQVRAAAVALLTGSAADGRDASVAEHLTPLLASGDAEVKELAAAALAGKGPVPAAEEPDSSGLSVRGFRREFAVQDFRSCRESFFLRVGLYYFVDDCSGFTARILGFVEGCFGL